MEKYNIQKVLGDGTFGVVYRAINNDTGEVVAIKKMKRKFSNWEECRNLREVKSLIKLSHPNIMLLKEVLKVKDELYLVFEFLSQNLFQAYGALKEKGKTFTEDQLRSIIYQSSTALAYMHKHGFFHRDLKPENILIHRDKVKLADFGLAREIRSRPPYTDYVSTRWYRGPELLLKCTNYNSPVDIFALGCIMAELFMNAPLFSGGSELEQMYKICSVLGTPSKDSWAEGYRLASQIGFNFPQFNPVSLSSIITNASQDALNLLSEMLQFDPQKRITAAGILQHPWLEGFSPDGILINDCEPLPIAKPKEKVDKTEKETKQDNHSKESKENTRNENNQSREPTAKENNFGFKDPSYRDMSYNAALFPTVKEPIKLEMPNFKTEASGYKDNYYEPHFKDNYKDNNSYKDNSTYKDNTSFKDSFKDNLYKESGFGKDTYKDPYSKETSFSKDPVSSFKDPYTFKDPTPYKDTTPTSGFRDIPAYKDLGGKDYYLKDNTGNPLERSPKKDEKKIETNNRRKENPFSKDNGEIDLEALEEKLKDTPLNDKNAPDYLQMANSIMTGNPFVGSAYTHTTKEQVSHNFINNNYPLKSKKNINQDILDKTLTLNTYNQNITQPIPNPYDKQHSELYAGSNLVFQNNSFSSGNDGKNFFGSSTNPNTNTNNKFTSNGSPLKPAIGKYSNERESTNPYSKVQAIASNYPTNSKPPSNYVGGFGESDALTELLNKNLYENYTGNTNNSQRSSYKPSARQTSNFTVNNNFASSSTNSNNYGIFNGKSNFGNHPSQNVLGHSPSFLGQYGGSMQPIEDTSGLGKYKF
jgi:male germ cell-associated kinase